MNIGLGIGIPFNRSQIWLSLFDPSKLFTSGVNGAWYDPSDINLTWRRNLLTYSEQFDNAVWDKTSFPVTVTADAIAAPNGANTADLVVPTAASAAHGVRQIGLSVGTSTSFSVYAKSAGYDRVQLYLQNVGGFGHITFSLASGTVTNTVSGSVTVTGSITSAGNGWYLLSVAGAGATTVSVLGIIPLNAAANGATLGPVYAGDGTSGIYIWGAQLEQGSTATAYQRITDGVQDYLQYQAQPVLYRDAAGTLPVTAVEQPVGLMLDKSKGLVLGPELVTNGDFSSDTWWLKGAGCAITGGAGVATAAASGSGWYKTGLLAIGNYYEIAFTVVSCSAGAFRVGFFATAYSQAYSAPGTYTVRLRADGTGFVVETVGITTGSIDNVSVKQVSGNHAFNSSGNSANFPVLSARVNLLTKTEDFSDAVWTKQAGTTVSSTKVAAPDGTLTAFSVTGNGTSGIHQGITGTLSLGQSVRSVYLRVPTGTATVGIKDPVLTQGTTTCNLTTSWQRFTLTETTPPSGGFVAGIWIFNIPASGIEVAWPDTRSVNDALNQPAYQRVNTSTDYDTVGFKPYLRFNGVSQWLQTNSIDFTYSDKMFVCAGVRKLSDAAIGIVAELSALFYNYNGTFALAAPGGSPVGYEWSSRGTANGITNTGFSAPITNVISGIGNISGDQAILRINGAQAATSTADQGTGNYGNYPLYIGARAGTSLFFNGRLYGMVIVGKQASSNEIQDTEKYLNNKTVAYN